MKTKSESVLDLKVLALIASISVLAFAGAQANDDLMGDSDDEVLNNEQIDIDGSFQNRPKETAADRMEKMRRKLEEQNEQMVQKRIEDMRIREEQRLSGKLANAFDGGLEDEVSTVQASTVEAPAPETTTFKSIRVIPTLGIMNVRSQAVDFESNLAFGIGAEADINQRFSAGATFKYASMDINDLSATTNGYGNFYNQNYFNYFGNQGRQMKYKQFGLELNGKFFILTNSRIRPYVGAGLGYNRANLRYGDGQAQQQQYNPYMYNGNQIGQENQFTSSFVTGSALLGTQIAFTSTVGMAAEFSYTKGLTSNSSDAANVGQNLALNPDQDRLNRVGNSIGEASFFGINVGLVVSF